MNNLFNYHKMFGQCLLQGVGIGGVSTGIYAAFTNDKYDNRDRKDEFITIFCIILLVSTILLFMFSSSSESLTTISDSPSIGGGKPPF